MVLSSVLVEIPEPGSLKWTDLTVPGLWMALFMEESDVIPQINQSKKPLTTLGTFFCFLPHCVDVANVTTEISLTFELFPALHTADLLSRVESLNVGPQDSLRLHHGPALHTEKAVRFLLVKGLLVSGQTTLILQQFAALIAGQRVGLTTVNMSHVILQRAGLLEAPPTKLADFLEHHHPLQDLFIQRALSLPLVGTYQVRMPAGGFFPKDFITKRTL